MTAQSNQALQALDSPPLLRFGLVTDCHYADGDPVDGVDYSRGLARLRHAFGEFNKHELAFILQLGDLVNHGLSSFATVAKVLAEPRARVLNLLGNHDFDVPPDRRSEVPGLLGMQETYHVVHATGVRLLVLDTTAQSTYRYPEGTPEHKAAAAELVRREAAGDPNALFYNSGLGDTQLAWLQNELAAAQGSGDLVLAFGHHPLLPVDDFSQWDTESVAALLEEATCVKAYLCGHKHAGAYARRSGLHYLTLNGMFDPGDDNAFAIAGVHPDRLELTGFGRQESRTLPFR